MERAASLRAHARTTRQMQQFQIRNVWRAPLQSYGAASDAAHIAFGGSSFGGICALWAAMHHSDKFGAVLVESPSLWFAEERFLRWGRCRLLSSSLEAQRRQHAAPRAGTACACNASAHGLSPVPSPAPLNACTPRPHSTGDSMQGGPGALRGALAAAPLPGHGGQRVQRHAQEAGPQVGQAAGGGVHAAGGAAGGEGRGQQAAAVAGARGGRVAEQW